MPAEDNLPILIRELSKTFRGKKGRTVNALRHVDLSVAQGEVFGFLGPNGAGKSTTIKTLVGQIKPSAGEVFLFGQPSETTEAKMRLGYLPENPAFYDFLSAQEYLAFVGKCFGLEGERLDEAIKQQLDLLSLADAANRPIRNFSKGMVQRLGLAQAMLHDPDLYILDEPMSGLDPVGRSLVKNIILDLKKRKKTVFFSSHVISDVEAVCDRVGIITSGKMRVVSAVTDVILGGVEGFSVVVSKCSAAEFVDFSPIRRDDDSWRAFIPEAEHRVFMERLFALNGKLELVETQRKSLESLFLDIVDRS